MSKGPSGPKHCEVHGRFLPDECMSPAFFTDQGLLVFATYAPDALFPRSYREQWEATNAALLFVQQAIRKRQEEIDKKVYAQDETLQRLRKRALAIHQRRIEINVTQLKAQVKE